MGLTKGLDDIITKHVFDGLMRPFDKGSADTSWHETAPLEKWGALHYGKKAEETWKEYISAAKNKDGMPLMTVPDPGYEMFQDASSVVCAGGEYTTKKDTGPNGGVIVTYKDADLSGVSPDDFWYSDPDEPALVLSVNPSEKTVEIFGMSSKAADEKGVGTGSGIIKTGGKLGTMVEKYITLNPPSSKLLKYNVSGATGCFESEETITGGGQTATLAGTNGVKKIFFKKDPEIAIGPPPVGLDPMMGFKVELLEPLAGPVNWFQMVSGHISNKLSGVIAMIVGNIAYTTSAIMSYKQNIPSGVVTNPTTETAEYVELVDCSGDFPIGCTITGSQSGTTATITSRDGSDDYDGHPVQESTEVRDAMLKMIGSSNKSNCIVGPATIPLPVIVI